MAYSLHNSDEIFVHTGWSATKISAKTKPKIVILLDENQEPIGFGEDAKFKLKIIIY